VYVKVHEAGLMRQSGWLRAQAVVFKQTLPDVQIIDFRPSGSKRSNSISDLRSSVSTPTGAALDRSGEEISVVSRTVAMIPSR
jgi:hypothetical protein